MAKERIQWLDIVKGIAILGVVLQHTFQRLMTYYNLNDDVILNYLNKIVVSCNMELFFFISGVIF
ncbi:MAG: acyltransferase family protein, partial [Phocaeicola sp.]